MTKKNDLAYIDENLRIIRERCAEAKDRFRSSDDNIRIMAVTKTVAPEAINHAVELGIDLLGENRVQEFLAKEPYYLPVHKHFIGHLQTNKVKDIVGKVEMIHSVDSLHLAKEISKQSVKRDIVSDILLEVNVGAEESKYGFTPYEVLSAAGQIAELPGVRLRGLMAIPPVCRNAGENIEYFKELYKLFIDFKGKKIDNSIVDTLSMGMSDDFEAAIRCGATAVRVGTALFGRRNYNI